MSLSDLRRVVLVSKASDFDRAGIQHSFSSNGFGELDDLHTFIESGDPMKMAVLWDTIRAGCVRTIICLNLGAFGDDYTSTQDWIRLFDFFARSDVRFISIEDQLDTAGPAAAFLTALPKAIERKKQVDRINKIHRSFEKARARGQGIGRPKKTDDEKVRTLRDGGHTIKEISEALMISRGAVQYSLRNDAAKL